MADEARIKREPADEARIKREPADESDDEWALNPINNIKNEMDIGDTIIKPLDLLCQRDTVPIKEVSTGPRPGKRAAARKRYPPVKQLIKPVNIFFRKPANCTYRGRVSTAVAETSTSSSSNMNVTPASDSASDSSTPNSSSHKEVRESFPEIENAGSGSESDVNDGDNEEGIDRFLAQTYNFHLEDDPQVTIERAQEDADDVDEVAEANNPMFVSYTKAEDAALEEEVTSLGQMSFVWSKDFAKFSGKKETLRVPHGPTISCTDPTQCFLNIWDEVIVQQIVEETNRYAESVIESKQLSRHSRLNRWVPISLSEMYTLIHIFILQSVMALENEHAYWYPASEWLNTPFNRLMSFNRYILLKGLLCFVDNSTIDPDDDVGKIQPIVNHCNDKFQDLYNLRQDIAIHESLTDWKGKVPFLQYVWSKTSKARKQTTTYGVKTNSYELCESQTGYVWNVFVCTQKELHITENQKPTPTAKITLGLMNKLFNRGHCLWMDNFYQCPLFARLLKSRGTDCVGSLRCNRKNVPQKLASLENDDMPHNVIESFHSGDVMVLCWKEADKVAMISTYHHGDTTGIAMQGGQTALIPTVILDYNVIMTRVELKNQRLSNFWMERAHNRKWHLKIFKRLLNISLLNSYIIYCESISVMPEGKRPKALRHREFRYAIAKGLHRRYNYTGSLVAPTVPAFVTMENRLLLGSNNHEPLKMSKGVDHEVIIRQCIYCSSYKKRARTSLACSVCMVPLCITPCFYNFHHVSEITEIEKRIYIDAKCIYDVPA